MRNAFFKECKSKEAGVKEKGSGVGGARAKTRVTY